MTRHFHADPKTGTYRLAFEDCPCRHRKSVYSFVPTPIPARRISDAPDRLR